MLTFEQLLQAAQCEQDDGDSEREPDDGSGRERDEDDAQHGRDTGPQRRSYAAYRRAIIMCDRDRAHLAFLREKGRIEYIARRRREAQAAAEAR
jgi:hypothetical protein